MTDEDSRDRAWNADFRVGLLAPRASADGPPGRSGLLVAAIAIGAFVPCALAPSVPSLRALDVRVTAAIHDLATPSAATAMQIVSFFGSTLFTVAIGVLGALWFFLRRERARMIAGLVALLGGIVLEWALKAAFARPRPESALDVARDPYAFPSGHATFATLVFGFAAWLACRSMRGGARVVAAGGAALAIAAVSSSRLVLGQHHASDVVAGIAVGAAWLALATRVGQPARHRSSPRT